MSMTPNVTRDALQSIKSNGEVGLGQGVHGSIGCTNITVPGSRFYRDFAGVLSPVLA